MPYQLQKNCVMKKNPDGTLTTVKCHPTRDKALAHLRALYANVPDASKEITKASRPGLIKK